MNPPLGIALKIGSTVVFTLMLACVKQLAETVPQGQIVFARSFFALVPITAMLLWQGHFRSALRTRHPWIHLSRGTVGVCSMALNFTALSLLPLPEAMTIGYAAPLMIVVLAALILGERVRLFRWTAVSVGLLGVLVILWPRLTLLQIGAFNDSALLGTGLALISAFLSAFAAIFVRSMTATEGTGTIVFYFSVTSALLSLLSLPFGWVVPDLTAAALLIFSGLLGGVGQIMMTSAYRHATAATIAPLEYVSIIWGLIIGYVLFAELPHQNVAIGGAIVVGAGVVIILRERQLGMQRVRQRRASSP